MACRSTGRATSVPAATDRATSTDPAASLEGRDGLDLVAVGEERLPRGELMELLRAGEMEIAGRLMESSNLALICRVRLPCPDPQPDRLAVCVYKPIRGERPLDDFPRGTLASREVGAYLVSQATGWDIVPPTLLRDGPYGRGMVQLWVETDDETDPIEIALTADPRLRRMAVFDAIVNNADRKAGHLLPLPGGHVQGCDHGICFSVEPKLRTILWGWRGEALRDDELAGVERVREGLDGTLGDELERLLSRREVHATRRRCDALLEERRFPMPDPLRPAIPWPPF